MTGEKGKLKVVIGEKYMDTTRGSMVIYILPIHAFMHACMLIGAEIDRHIEESSTTAAMDTSNVGGGRACV